LVKRGVDLKAALREDMAQVTETGKQFWVGKRVLITGASGMVGSWLVKELLALGARISVLVHDSDPQAELFRSGDIHSCSVVNGSLADYWSVERAVNEQEVDTVFHLGAQTIVGTANRSPLPTFEANVRGTYNLLEACRVHAAMVQRVVIASSDKAYGDQEQLPYTEAAPLIGRHPYDVSKSCADLIAQAYHHTYKLPVAIARCGNVYGGGDLNWSRIVPGTIREFLRNRPIVLRSDGTYIRDYIYVKDAARGYLRLAECLDDQRVRGEGFNFSTESPLTVLQIVEAIQKLMRREDLQPVIENSASGEIRNQWLSAAKARDVLGWRAEYDLESGLAETVAWYRLYLRGSASAAL
jgi:CDP-glucose 4,6-dehydratase